MRTHYPQTCMRVLVQAKARHPVLSNRRLQGRSVGGATYEGEAPQA